MLGPVKNSCGEDNGEKIPMETIEELGENNTKEKKCKWRKRRKSLAFRFLTLNVKVQVLFFGASNCY